MFDNLTDRLDKAFKLLKGQGHITEINVAETLKDVRKALLDADVSYKISKSFTETVKEKALGQNVLTSVSPGQLMVKVVHEELTALMGGEHEEINIKGKPAIVLISGLQGSGKTTLTAKLAYHLKNKRSKKILLVAGDVYRPAAIDQLKVLGEQAGVEVFTEEGSKDPLRIAKKAVTHAKTMGHDVVIVDTAGRLAIDEQMMNEISSLKKELNPQETLFVVDAMTGQDAVNTAKAFNDRLDFDGVVLTKLDGDTRGGAALTIRSVVEKPIKFVGIGEKIDALDLFYPKRMADRILGMGDIVSLVEKAQEQFDQEEARTLQKKMGNVKDLMGMIPGMGKAIKDVDLDDDAFKGIEAIIYSMTPEERQNPSLLNGARRKRIADGSGNDIQEVNKLIKQFADTRKMMKMMSGGGGKIKNMMKGMQGMRK
jgi:signal recognition particle subunit SRP54